MRWFTNFLLLLGILSLAACQTDATTWRVSPMAYPPTQAEATDSLLETARDFARPALTGNRALLAPLAIHANARWDYVQLAYAPPEILLGAVPDDMPFQLAHPDFAVVGSITEHTEPGDTRREVYLLTRLKPAGTIDALRVEFTVQGLAVLEPEPIGGVLFPNFGILEGIAFCNQARDTMIKATVYPATDKPTPVRISVIRSDLCTWASADEFAIDSPETFWRPLPILVTPPGVDSQKAAGSWDSDRVSRSANLTSERRLPAILTDYNEQLQEAGWQKLREDRNPHVAWSRWRSTDAESRPWSATLLLVADPVSETEMTIELTAERQ